jgi:hypothetical protein
MEPQAGTLPFWGISEGSVFLIDSKTREELESWTREAAGVDGIETRPSSFKRSNAIEECNKKKITAHNLLARKAYIFKETSRRVVEMLVFLRMKARMS